MVFQIKFTHRMDYDHLYYYLKILLDDWRTRDFIIKAQRKN